MKVFAHRGFHEKARENTLEAIQAARDAGAHGVEVDVRLTRDGRAVLFHDALAPGNVPISGLTGDELCRACGYAVPTLEEALRTFPDIEWDVELKTKETLEEAVRLLRNARDRSRIVVTSFSYLLAMRAGRKSGLPFGVICARRPRLPVFLVKPVRPAAMVWRLGAASCEDLAMLREEGIATYVYGPVTARQHERCRELKPDVVITDTPWRLLGQRDGTPRE